MGPEVAGVVLYGGTFSPIHLGHLIVAEEVRQRLGGGVRVIFMPAAQPPHKAAVPVDAKHRLEMVRLATASNPDFEVSDLEIRRGGTSYTIDTIRRLLEQDPGRKIYLLVGADSVPDLPSWRDAVTLLGLCQVVVAARPGWSTAAVDALKATFSDAIVDGIRRHAFPTPRVEISSTEIRRRLAAGESVRYWVPEPVLEYLNRNRLYRSA